MLKALGSRPEAPLFAAVYLVQLVLDGLLTVLGLRRTLTLLVRLASAWRPQLFVASRSPDDRISVLVRALDRAGHRYRWRGACLRRSVALWWWLNANGTHAWICLGANLHGESLIGHAWVEVGGRPVAELTEQVSSNILFTRYGWQGSAKVVYGSTPSEQIDE